MGSPARWGQDLLRRVTGLGRLTAVSAVLAWVGGWALGWRELMLIAAALAVALVVAYLFTLGRANLEVAVTLDRQRVVVGQQAVGALEVTNRARSRLLPLRIDTPVGPALVSVEVPSLGAGERFEEVFIVPTTRRAVIPLGPARSVQGDSLGLVRRVVAWTDPLPLYVHPRTERLEGLVTGLVRDLEGRSTNDLSQSDVSFHTLRDYVIGDDRRHVHWRSSARLGRLVVRQFVDTRRSVLGVVLSLDPEAYTSGDELELAISAAGSIGLSALAEDQTVVCLAGATLVPTHAPEALLDRLAGLELDPPAGLEDEAWRSATARRSLRALEPASVIAVVTGSATSPDELRRTASRYRPGAAVVAFRCAPGAPGSTVRSAGNVTVVDIGSLGHLRRQVMAGVMT